MKNIPIVDIGRAEISTALELAIKLSDHCREHMLPGSMLLNGVAWNAEEYVKSLKKNKQKVSCSLCRHVLVMPIYRECSSMENIYKCSKFNINVCSGWSCDQFYR